MFHEVRVFDGYGSLKGVITKEELSMRHWADENVIQDAKVIPHLAAKNGSHEKRPLPERKCKQCLRKFLALTVNQRYCGKVCFNAVESERKARSLKPKRSINCSECGNEFESRRMNHLRCSDKCRQVAHRRLVKDRNKIMSDKYEKQRELKKGLV